MCANLKDTPVIFRTQAIYGSTQIRIFFPDIFCEHFKQFTWKMQQKGKRLYCIKPRPLAHTRFDGVNVAAEEGALLIHSLVSRQLVLYFRMLS